MPNFDDARWRELRLGYRTPYGPRKALLSLERGTDVSAARGELWEELHHQGDVGVASYAAVRHLVRIRADAGRGWVGLSVTWNAHHLRPEFAPRPSQTFGPAPARSTPE